MVERYRRVEIYCAYNTVTNKCYVGQTRHGVSLRLKQHKWSKKSPFARALRKYGERVFRFGIVAVGRSQSSANELEKFWILELDSRVPNGYNLTGGGEGAIQLPPDILARRNRNIGLANKKNKPTEEQRANLSIKIKALWEDSEYRERQLIALYGFAFPKKPKRKLLSKTERRRRMREAHGTVESRAKKRRCQLERWELEDRKAHGEMMKEIMARPENKAKRSERAKEVWAKKSEKEMLKFGETMQFASQVGWATRRANAELRSTSCA